MYLTPKQVPEKFGYHPKSLSRWAHGRFGFEFIEWFCSINNCRIEILNNTYKSPHQELMDDFMAVMHCFSSKLYFLRSYEKKIKSEIDKTDK